MSVHLIDQASYVQLPSHLKVALLCFADSGRDSDRIAFPGIEGLMRWCGVGEKQAYKLISQLIELRLVEKRRGGYRGRRAEYVVFPDGCCELHGKRPARLQPVRVAEIDDVVETVTAALAIQDSPTRESCQPVDTRLVGDSSEPKIRIDRRQDSHLSRQDSHDPRSNGRPSFGTPSDTSPGGHLTGPVTSRDTDVTIDFSKVVDLQPWEEPAAPPPGRCPLSNCVDGQLVDDRLLPIAACPVCARARQAQPVTS